MKSCDEIQVICSKSQYGEASFWERLQFKLHLIICKACRGFTKRNSHLSTLLQRVPENGLSKAEKQAIKDKLNNEI